ncbi:MAG TPA: RNA 2',3'-cyclic phosphodiesterase [Clostridiales bacterium]|nr:RNA 2',3'-cyclic phosphodiesterase [Clostridiales bacterium]
MRLFIAINFEKEALEKLTAVREDLRKRAKQGNFSRDENLHLTLAFLGECKPEQLKAARSALESLDFEPFELEAEGLGRFRREGGDIYWVGIRPNEKLEEIHKQITKKLADTFSLDSKKFTPHITLGREVILKEKPANFGGFSQTVYSIDLMKSERAEGVLTYTRIYSKRADRTL